MTRFYFIPLTFTFLSVFLNSFSQERKVSAELMNVKDVFEVANFDRTRWELYAKYHSTEDAPVKAENVIADIDKYLSKVPTTDGRNGEIKEYNLIKKYRDNLDSTFRGLQLLSRDQLGEFMYDIGVSLPVEFGLYGDTALSVIISGIFIDKIYNTLKLTSKQRATKVVTTYILPSFKALSENFTNKEIKYFGMTCVYGSKDFTDESTLATKSEFVAFIAPVSLIRKYVSGDLTEDELVEASDVYISDRDMVTDIKKIKIVIE
ncbi:MAG: hypothetical protein ABJB05_07635 [Parafilimonas sp.]